MKTRLPLLLCLTIASNVKADYWTQKADFPVPTVFAVGFSIGDSGYAGTGAIPSYVNTFYKYDPIANTWTTKANFGGMARAGASGFAINGKGYIVNGGSQSAVFTDCWEYDAAADAWTQKADFPGSERYSSAAFVINGKAYVGLGDDGIYPYNDFYEFDPANNTWVTKADLGTTGRTRGASFSIGNKGYFGCGHDANQAYLDEFWEYDPAGNSWTQKADFPGGHRIDPAGFSAGNYGYMGTGWTGAFPTHDWYQYDPSSNSWIQKTDFGGLSRNTATGFTIGDRIYLGTGGNAIFYYQDWWEYTPDTITGIPEKDPTLALTIFPNPVRDFCELHIGNPGVRGLTQFYITDVTGKSVGSQSVAGTQTRIDFRKFPAGWYFVEVIAGNRQGIIKVCKI